MAFIQRLIEVDFRLGPNPQTGAARLFPETGTDTITLSGLRAAADVVKAGAPGQNTLDLRVWGMTLSQMLALHTWGQIAPGVVAPNFVSVRAGDAQSGLSTAFSGGIMSSFIDASSAPDVVFVVAASGAYVEAMTTVPDISIQGTADARQIMANLAEELGLVFEDGLAGPVILTNPHYSGSGHQMAIEVARDGNFRVEFDDGVLAIFPMGGSRVGGPVVIGPGRGLVGYPTFRPEGVMVKTEFNHLIRQGGTVTIAGSALAPANNTWSIWRLDHTLESMVPNGAWFSSVYGHLPGTVPTGNS